MSPGGGYGGRGGFGTGHGGPGGFGPGGAGTLGYGTGPGGVGPGGFGPGGTGTGGQGTGMEFIYIFWAHKHKKLDILLEGLKVVVHRSQIEHKHWLNTYFTIG